MKILSIVVPIYGVEKYIGKFLESLVPNLCSEIEVFLVDDGSKDNCATIIDEFAKAHDNIEVIHKVNGGVSSARNAGIEKATGEYITFLDPDDYIAGNYASTLLETVKKYDSPDFLIYDYYRVEYDGEVKDKSITIFKEGRIEKNIFLKELIKQKHINCSVCTSIIKRKFYKSLRFDVKTKYVEDYLFLTNIALNVNDIVYLKRNLYYYVGRKNSLSTGESLRDRITAFEIALDRYRKYKDVLGDASIVFPTNLAYTVLQRGYLGEWDSLISECEEFIKKNIGEILFDKDISFGTKRQCMMVYLGVAERYIKFKYKRRE